MRLRAHPQRASLMGATLVAAAFIAGCGSSPASSPVALSAPAPGSVSGLSVSAPPAEEAGGSAVEPCTTTDLKVWSADGGGGDAVSYYSFIDFTNISTAQCTLYGYPGVSLTTASGAQIGAAASRRPTPPARLLTLAPGATVYAELQTMHLPVYPPGKCRPETSAYLKIYPPGQTQSAMILSKGPTCENPAVKMLSISAVTAGALPTG